MANRRIMAAGAAALFTAAMAAPAAAQGRLPPWDQQCTMLACVVNQLAAGERMQLLDLGPQQVALMRVCVRGEAPVRLEEAAGERTGRDFGEVKAGTCLDVGTGIGLAATAPDAAAATVVHILLSADMRRLP